MEAVFDATFFGTIFVTFFVILDPPGNIPLFLGLTRSETQRSRARLAWQAALTAFLVTVAFAAFGQQILNYLGISLPALQTAGGLLLLLVALELLTGRQDSTTDGASTGGGNVALVPLGTPLLAGPGAIVTAIVYVRRTETVPDLVALAVALVSVHIAVWLTLRFSGLIIRVIKDNGIQLLTRISGLLLSAIAVQLIADAIRDFVRGG